MSTSELIRSFSESFHFRVRCLVSSWGCWLIWQTSSQKTCPFASITILSSSVGSLRTAGECFVCWARRQLRPHLQAPLRIARLWLGLLLGVQGMLRPLLILRRHRLLPLLRRMLRGGKSQPRLACVLIPAACVWTTTARWVCGMAWHTCFRQACPNCSERAIV